MYTGLHVKYRLFLSDFNKTQFLSTDLKKTPKYKISCKLVQWELGSYMGTDRRMDRRYCGAIVTLYNLANAPKTKSF